MYQYKDVSNACYQDSFLSLGRFGVGGALPGNVNQNDHWCVNSYPSLPWETATQLWDDGILIQVSAVIIIITPLLENV